jgi:hypothetical protein
MTTQKLLTWWERHNAILDAECKFSRGDKVQVSEDIIEELEYLPEVAQALKVGTRIGTVHARIQSLYNGGEEPRYEVLLDDVAIHNVQYNESELTLVEAKEIVELDNEIRVAEQHLATLKGIRDRLAKRISGNA